MSFDEEKRLQLAELDEKIELGRTLVELDKDLNFRKLMDHYTKKLPLELTYSLGRIDKDQINTDNVTRRLESIALFRNFLEEIRQDYDMSITDKNNLLSNGATNETN